MKRLYAILLITLAIFGLAGFVFWRYFYLGTLTLDVTPKDSLVTVNGKPTPDRIIKLPQGTYTIEITAPGYRKESFNLQTGYGSQTAKKVALISLPKPTKIIEGPLRSVAATQNKDKIFFERQGVLYQYDLTAAAGTPGIPITPALSNLATVTWSPDFKLALLKKTDGEIGLYDFNRYDLLHQEYRPYGKDFKQVVWSPDGDGFYAEYKVDSGEHSLVKANTTNTNLTRLAPLGQFPIPKFSMLASSPLSLIMSGTDQTQPSDIIRFDAHQKTYSLITETTNAYGPTVSPNKTKIAFLDNGELVAADIDGKNKRNLGVRPKVNNYTFSDEKTLLAFSENLVTAVNVTDGTKREYAVSAPSDAIAHFIALPTGKAAYYLYQNDLYRLDFEGTP
jgi:hypothetical protein